MWRASGRYHDAETTQCRCELIPGRNYIPEDGHISFPFLSFSLSYPGIAVAGIKSRISAAALPISTNQPTCHISEKNPSQRLEMCVATKMSIACVEIEKWMRSEYPIYARGGGETP